ncbi:MAG: hypothetical protein QGI25_09115, partial [Arenicellales bacterium]|nr:hypothetical protein [Arenicellales bacterium]
MARPAAEQLQLSCRVEGTTGMIRFLRSRGPPQRALIETGVLALLLLSLTALIGISHYLLD